MSGQRLAELTDSNVVCISNKDQARIRKNALQKEKYHSLSEEDKRKKSKASADAFREKCKNNPEWYSKYRNSKNELRNSKYKSDPEYRSRLLAEQVKSRRGISKSQYDTMMIAQNGVCAICRNPEFGSQNGKVKRLSVDHCHNSGKIRGLLCNGCNPGIGYFKDNPALLRAAADYIEKQR